MKKVFLGLGFFILFTPPAFADDISGLYETTHDNGFVAPLDENGECTAPNEIMDGSSMCITPYESTNQFGAILQDNGDLAFKTMLMFFNGHSCSLDGVAQPIHENHWVYRYEEEGNPDSHCALDIVVSNDSILLNAKSEANCRYFCGARGAFYNIRFPLSSKTQDITSLRCIANYNTPDNCNNETAE